MRGPLGGGGFGGVPPKTAIPLAAYLDGVTRVPGTTPASTPPNAYDTSGPNGGSQNYFSRVRMTGRGPFKGQAVPWTAQSALGLQHTIGVWVDDVFHSTIDLGGGATPGVKVPFTLTLDGAVHVVDFEEQASLTDLSGGAFTLYTPPAKRFVPEGDSILAGFNATVLSNSWGDELRHSLPAPWLTSIWGIPGRAMFGSQNSWPDMVARCDGTAANVGGIALQINDFIGGVPIASYSAALDIFCAGFLGALPNAKLLLISSPQTFLAPTGGGGTLQQYRDVMAAKAASNPTHIFYLDNSALFPGGTPWATYLAGDGIHFLDPGMALMAAAVKAALLALP